MNFRFGATILPAALAAGVALAASVPETADTPRRDASERVEVLRPCPEDARFVSRDCAERITDPVLVEQLATQQPDRSINLDGPPLQAAFDADGDALPCSICAAVALARR